MNNLHIEKIYLENYKIFDNFSLDFCNGLNVFDGPNGYGKTSVFDAIEFLITGDIRRVTSCSAIDGKFSYQKVFFSKDKKKDVIIKAQFKTEEESFVIVKKIPGGTDDSGTTEYNPKKLKDITQTFIIPNFDYIDYEERYMVDREKLVEMQVKYFGSTTQSLYTLLYYIQQEDRLDYFKNNEKSRVGTINSLFQIDKEKNKLIRITQAKKKLKKLIDALDIKIEGIQKGIVTEAENIPGNELEYKKMFEGNIYWDNPEPQLAEKEILDNALQILVGIKSLLHYQEYYVKDKKNQEYMHFLNNADLDKQLQAFILFQQIGQDYDSYKERKKCAQFLVSESQKAEKQDYLNMEFERIGEYLGKKVECAEILEYIDEYKEIKKTSAAAQTSINELLKIRNRLKECNNEDIKYHESKCLFCGYDWKEKSILTKNIDSTTEEIETLLGTTGKRMNQIFEQIRSLYKLKIEVSLNEKLNQYGQDKRLELFCGFDENDLKSKHDFVNTFFVKSNIMAELSEEKYDVESLKKIISEKKDVLPEEYYQKKKEYQFDVLVKDYFKNFEEVSAIVETDIEYKEKYLKFYFHLQQKEKLKKVNELMEKQKRLKQEVDKAITQYSKDWKASISKYQGEIISKIEIPFYIYSARILQSYQAGQGILIRDRSAKGEVDAIRFTSPSEEHDILYTMSSGQLSGILLAFSLALHKIFANDGLNVLLIDDPVQCMDDLNIVSFVELMRTEFPKIQLLISTHENSFAKYIIYKYDKYGIPSQRCNLKDVNIN